jgi:hypothetical protein
MRRCYIHIGTHKTGTTSIQRLLARNSATLLERGFLYPESGRMDEAHPGHHNIAWQVTRDRRFDKRLGTIDDLAREVRARHEHVVLSSEDFESAVGGGTGLGDLVARMRSLGFRVTVVLYVRKQWEYLPRVYCTLLHFGFHEPFERMLECTLERGEFGWREWTFKFDYYDVVQQLRAIADVEVDVRAYDAARTSVCADFLSTFGLTLADLHVAGEVVENVSLPLATYARMFVRNRFGRVPDEEERAFAEALAPPGVTNSAVSPPVQQMVARRFLDANRTLSLRYGVPEIAWDELASATALPDVPYVDDVFSERSDVMSFGGAGVPLR